MIIVWLAEEKTRSQSVKTISREDPRVQMARDRLSVRRDGLGRPNHERRLPPEGVRSGSDGI